MNLHDVARQLRAELSDPYMLCGALGLGLRPEDRQRQARGVTVRCPRHQGVSCSVTRAEEGGIRVQCFGCGFTADALGLIAEAQRLDIRRDFRLILATGAQIASRWDLANALRFPRQSASDARPPFMRTKVPAPMAKGAPTLYPPQTELAALWRACIPCGLDDEASALLERRGIRVDRVDDFHLARALPPTASLPAWASFRGARPRRVSWIESGHRLILPVYDALGRMRSVRAWCIRDTDDPKRVPPAGYASRHLVLACAAGVMMLRAGGEGDATGPSAVVIAEGEPDFLTWATRWSDAAESVPIVLGVFAGAWSDAVAERIPPRARVVVRTHHDPAGEAYAEAIGQSLEGRASVLRSRGTP
ncbi:MAG: hypothetical protein ABSC94_32070 [Polyangiaceae bacterium]|jgi:hypothetical protein